MTLPASFPLSMSQVATELGVALPLSLDAANVRSLAGVATGPISFSNLLGKSSASASTTYSASPNYTSAAVGTRTASIRFYADGTSGVISSGSLSAGANWYSTTTAGIGGGWYVRLTTISNSNTNLGYTSGTWYLIGSGTGISIGFTNSGTSLEGIGSAHVDFSPDNGTTIISSGTVSWDVGYVP